MIHFYFGLGKGKTTAAAGLCLRYASRAPAIFAQFLKGGESGETAQLRKLGVPVYKQNREMPFTYLMSGAQKAECAAEQRRVFVEATNAAIIAARESGACLLVLDEIVDAFDTATLDDAPVSAFIQREDAKKMEIIFTGHSMPAWLLAAADYVTEFSSVKHPFEKGLPARAGVEF